MGRPEVTPLLGIAQPRLGSSFGGLYSTCHILSSYFILLPFLLSVSACFFVQFLPLISFLEEAPAGAQIIISLILDDIPEQLQRHILDPIVDDAVFRILEFEEEPKRRSLIRKGPSSINALITHGLKLLKTVVYLSKISANNGMPLACAFPLSAAAIITFGEMRFLLTRQDVKEVQSCKSKRDELVVNGSYGEGSDAQDRFISAMKGLKNLYFSLHLILLLSLAVSIPNLIAPNNQVTLFKLAEYVLSLDKTFTKFLESLPKARGCLMGISYRSIPPRLCISAEQVRSTRSCLKLWKETKHLWKRARSDANRNDLENVRREKYYEQDPCWNFLNDCVAKNMNIDITGRSRDHIFEGVMHVYRSSGHILPGRD
ncbi:unnamed protein product [Clonostachys chloroleuca]|uniref:Uncharacterized protein n=1 Tax=Clonostachys chloroleuca TaxID=1926264 RepID=A0AA35LRR2_9HYPO|nr:unnamed protein product [Clonostachys chloroleuca]